MFAAAFVTDPACDTNVAVKVQVGLQSGSITGETMHNNMVELISVRCQDLCKIRIGISFVKEYRQVQFAGQLQLRLEGIALNISWAEVPKVVV